MNRLSLFAASILGTLTIVGPTKAGAAGWPETIDLLTEEKSHAEACLNDMKNSGDAAGIRDSRDTYQTAKAAADGVIAGLTVALVGGYKPEDLPKIQANLDRAGAGLQEFCKATVRAVTAAKGNRGVVSDIVKAAVEPTIGALKSAAATLWEQHVETAKLEMETIKGQLQEAKWPDFGPAP